MLKKKISNELELHFHMHTCMYINTVNMGIASSKFCDLIYKQVHVFAIFPGKYYHRRNPSTKIWYERFWGHSSCREPDAKQHS